MIVYKTPEEAFVEYECGCDLKDFEESYCGIYDSERHFAEEMAEVKFGEDNPVIKEGYFNAEAYAITLFSSDYFSIDAPGVRVYVFRYV